MEIRVYNPPKGRLETIVVERTNDNTTWFKNCRTSHDIYSTADFEGDLLISEFGYTYPVRVYETSRVDIDSQKRARQTLRMRV